MHTYRSHLPQLDGGFFLTDAGLETDIIFNKGIPIREFASHTLLDDSVGREVLANYFRGFLTLARDVGAGFVLDTQTWKAHPHWANDLGATDADLARSNHDAVDFVAGLRAEFSGNAAPIVLNGLIGPRGDAYAPEAAVAADEAEEYHSAQIGWWADTDVDMVSALTFTQSDEAIGAVRAATAVKLPIVVSFTVETDGSLPTGEALAHAIEAVDAATNRVAAYFMVNCAHPTHIAAGLTGGGEWRSRILGVRANASTNSHEELDAATELDEGDPAELAASLDALRSLLPKLTVVGGCCGTDARHVAAMWGVS
jgi:homocysteine S-methyltransferase